MRKRSRFFMLSWSAVAFYCVFIFFLSSFPRPIPFLDPKKYPPDWILHIVEYMLLGWLLARALTLPMSRRSRIWIFAAALLLGTLYAVSDEWHQSFVPQRESSLHDVMADAAGILMGVEWWLHQRKPKERGKVV